jgi:hypothetical protein
MWLQIGIAQLIKLPLMMEVSLRKLEPTDLVPLAIQLVPDLHLKTIPRAEAVMHNVEVPVTLLQADQGETEFDGLRGLQPLLIQSLH